jgi:CheY-like chemotaxis protein
MGGTIYVESTLGRGSLFRVELPVGRADGSDMKTQKREYERIVGLVAGQPEYRILIVEDQRENWLLLQRLLEDAGFQVRVAEDGARGVDVFRSWRPQLIWMDLRLPVMGGLEAAQRIRELDGGGEVKIVAISASAFAHERDEVLAAGLDDFVRKPYRRSEIFDCMARQLGVQYLYGQGPLVSAGEPIPALRPEALAALPQELREDLTNALISLDMEWIAKVIGRVSELDNALGAALSGRADRFAYGEILDALQCREQR